MCSKSLDPSFRSCINKFDIVFLCETHLLSTDVFDPRILGFSLCYRSDRTSAKRGSGAVLVLVKSSICHRVSLLQSISNQEQLFILLDNYLVLGGVYIPPRPNSIDIDQRFCILQENIQQIKCMNYPIVLFGDFNARIGECPLVFENDNKTKFDIRNCDKTKNRSGRLLRDICNTEELVVLNGNIFNTGFTCWKHSGASAIDFILCSSDIIDRFHSGRIHNETIYSDHCIIAIDLLLFMFDMKSDFSYSFDSDIKLSRNASRKLFRDSYRSIDFQNDVIKDPNIQRISHVLEQSLDYRISLPKETLSVLVDDLMTSLRKVLSDYVGYKSSFGRSKKQHVSHPWIDKQCRAAAAYFRRCQNENRRKFTPQTYAKLRNAKKAYKAIVRRKRRQFEYSFLNSVFYARDSKHLWSMVQDKRRRPYNGKVSTLEFTEFLSEIASGKYTVDESLLREARVRNSVRANRTPSEGIMDEVSHFLREEFDVSLWKLGMGKAPGPDGFTGEVIQLIFPATFDIFENLFLCMYLSGITPNSWDCDIKVPVQKHGKSGNHPSHLRPITLVNGLTKIYERFLLSMLKEYFCTSENQAGFKQDYGCIQRVFCLTTLASFAKPLFCVFIDFSSFFDTVHTEILVDYLYSQNVPPSLCRAIHSMFLNLKAKVRMNNSLGHEFRVEVGIRQGSVISPFLGTAYLEQISSILQDVQGKVHFGTSSIDHILYADDMVIFTTDFETLQRKIDRVFAKCREIGLNINTQKTFWTVFNKRGRVERKLKIDGFEIEYMSVTKYLGVSISDKRSFKKHIDDRTTKSNRALAVCINFQKKYSTLRFPLFLVLYERMVLPSLLYGSEVYGWSLAKECDLVLYKQLKRYFRLPANVSRDALYWCLGILPLHFEIWIRSYKFWMKIISLSNKRLENQLMNLCVTLHNEGIKTWFGEMLIVFEQVGFQGDFIHWKYNDISENLPRFTDLVRKHLITTMKNSLNQSKYQFLIQVFPEHKKRLFLEYTNWSESRVFLKLLLSLHSFEIETGRHKNIDKSIRFCKYCMDKYTCTLGDESHHVFDCPQHYLNRRNCCQTLSIDNCQIVQALAGSIYLNVTLNTRFAVLCKYFASLLHDLKESKD